MIICLEIDVAGDIVLSGFPQFKQKWADANADVLQEEQTIARRVSILHPTMKLLFSSIVSAQADLIIVELASQMFDCQ